VNDINDHWTLAQLISEARRLVSIEEAEYLTMTFFNLPRHEIYLSQKILDPETVDSFFRLVSKAQTGVPIQYLVNSAPFLDFNLFVDERVFIPRPETEELVLRTSARLKEPKVILDYGTGAGCIAIALARIFPDAQIFAVDISALALQVASLNINRYGLKKQIQLKQVTSLYEPPLKFLTGRFDLVISNPPYIPTSRINKLADTVRKNEPIVALDGGKDGTRVINMILNYAPDFIRNGGLLALEIDETQGWFVRNKIPTADIETDFADKIRYAFWQKVK